MNSNRNKSISKRKKWLKSQTNHLVWKTQEKCVKILTFEEIIYNKTDIFHRLLGDEIGEGGAGEANRKTEQEQSKKNIAQEMWLRGKRKFSQNGNLGFSYRKIKP